MIPSEEGKKKINISIGTVVWIAFMSFSVGTGYATITDLEKILYQEVGGLRSDWERDSKMKAERIKVLEERLRELELGER